MQLYYYYALNVLDCPNSEPTNKKKRAYIEQTTRELSLSLLFLFNQFIIFFLSP